MGCMARPTRLRALSVCIACNLYYRHSCTLGLDRELLGSVPRICHLCGTIISQLGRYACVVDRDRASYACSRDILIAQIPAPLSRSAPLGRVCCYRSEAVRTRDCPPTRPFLRRVIFSSLANPQDGTQCGHAVVHAFGTR